jgi:hypothetical protein
MQTKKVNIEELGFELSDSRSLIFKLIDEKINACKLQYLSQWVKDHTVTTEERDEKIKALQGKKEDLTALFKECDLRESRVDFNVVLDLKLEREPIAMAV